MCDAFPQCGRASNGASAASTSVSAALTWSGRLRQVKWIASVSRSYDPLSHSRSAAVARNSDTSSSGVISGDSRRTASRAAAPRARSTKYSDWISSPLLGGESIRKCGSRSDHGPAAPTTVRLSTGASTSRGGPGSGRLPKNSGGAGVRSGSGPSRRRLTHAASSVWPLQSVNRLTL